MSPKQEYSEKRRKEVLAWLHSRPMSMSDELLTLGWALIEPYRMEEHWERLQQGLVTLSHLHNIHNRKGDPPCT